MHESSSVLSWNKHIAHLFIQRSQSYATQRSSECTAVATPLLLLLWATLSSVLGQLRWMVIVHGLRTVQYSLRLFCCVLKASVRGSLLVVSRLSSRAFSKIEPILLCLPHRPSDSSTARLSLPGPPA